MTILYAGTSVADFAIGGGTSLVTDATHLSPYVAEGVRLDGPASAKTGLFGPVSDLWVGFMLHVWDAAFGEGIRFYNSIGATVFSLEFSGFSDYGFELNIFNGSRTEAVGLSPKSLAQDSTERVDIHIKIDDVAGEFNVYLDGLLLVGFSGDTNRSADNAIVSVGWMSDDNSLEYDISAVIVADTDTRGMIFAQSKPTTNGARSDWTGDATDIDDLGRDDTNFIKSGTDGHVSTFGVGTLPAGLSGWDVHAVVVAGRALVGDDTTLDKVVRVGSTNYLSGDVGAGGIMGPVQHVFHQNPATAADWTFAEVDAIEVGVKLGITA